MNTDDTKRFFTDLYRDLVDRHLVLPAVALVVAIIAVPFVLGGGPEPGPGAVPVAPVAADADATAVESAVLTEDPGIRDYSQRLAALKQKNPFVQQFSSSSAATDPTTAAAEALAASNPAAGAGDLTSPTTGDSTGTGTGTATPETTTTPVTGGDTTPTTPTEPTQPAAPPPVRFFAPRVDVSFGKLGEAKEIDNVRYFDFLPNEKTPVAAFLGLGESADKAVFAVSNEVVETSGEGSCSPHNADGCDLLIMHIGQERMLKLVDGTTYRLKVLDTHFSRIPDPRAGETTSGDGAPNGAKPFVTTGRP
jgi:hypothetical protein